MKIIEIKDSPFSHKVFSTTAYSWIWVLVRFYVGYEWIAAGLDKIKNPVWIGEKAGVAITGFVQGALAKTSGPHPDVSSWYAWFLQNIVSTHPIFWSHLITYGEVAVGAGLILGAFTGIAAFFGLFMNMNYLFAGTVSINPILGIFSVLLILGWKVAGYIGLDRYLLLLLGTPWAKGEVFRK